MSTRDDARRCLIQAIHDHKNVDVTPEQLNRLKPSDAEIGTQDGRAWRRILLSAADCMRGSHPGTNIPARARANELLDQFLIESQLYLEELAGPARAAATRRASRFLLLGGLAGTIGAVALAIRALGARRGR